MSTENLVALYTKVLNDIAALARTYDQLNNAVQATKPAAATLTPQITPVTTTTAPPSPVTTTTTLPSTVTTTTTVPPSTTTLSALSAPTPLLVYFESKDTTPVYGTHDANKEILKDLLFSENRHVQLSKLFNVRYTETFRENEIYVVPAAVPKDQEKRFFVEFSKWFPTKLWRSKPKKVLLMLVFDNTKSAGVIDLDYPEKVAVFNFIAPVNSLSNTKTFENANKLLSELLYGASPLPTLPTPPLQRPVLFYVFPPYVEQKDEVKYIELFHNTYFSSEYRSTLRKLAGTEVNKIQSGIRHIYVLPAVIQNSDIGRKFMRAFLDYIARSIKSELQLKVILLLIFDDTTIRDETLRLTFPANVVAFSIIVSNATRQQAENNDQIEAAEELLESLITGKAQTAPSTTLSGAAASALSSTVNKPVVVYQDEKETDKDTGVVQLFLRNVEFQSLYKLYSATGKADPRATNQIYVVPHGFGSDVDKERVNSFMKWVNYVLKPENQIRVLLLLDFLTVEQKNRSLVDFSVYSNTDVFLTAADASSVSNRIQVGLAELALQHALNEQQRRARP